MFRNRVWSVMANKKETYKSELYGDDVREKLLEFAE